MTFSLRLSKCLSSLVITTCSAFALQPIAHAAPQVTAGQSKDSAHALNAGAGQNPTAPPAKHAAPAKKPGGAAQPRAPAGPAPQTQAVVIRGDFRSLLGGGDQPPCVADPGKLKNFKLWLETSKEPLTPTLVSLCGGSAIFLQPNLGDAKPTQVIVADALNQKAPAVASY